jgi:hypothetical protein
LFIFDSCFSGSIFEIRSERNVPPEIESKTAAPVRLFITAGTKNQPVPDDSIFRLYFVRAFEQREGDLNRDGRAWGDMSARALSRVNRGGGWSFPAVNCRSANRYYDMPDARSDNLGFRLARTAK